MASPSPTDSSEQHVRRSARGVVLDEEGRILLLHGRVQEQPLRSAWYVPGGRLEEGESWQEALRRELAEEVGLVVGEVGAHLWTRTSFRRRGGQDVPALARFYLVRTATFEPDTSNIGDSEAGVRWRWWTHRELLAEDTDNVIPPRLAELVAPVLAGELPAEPIDLR